jgi:valyl-tRNA synthetase
METHWIFGVSNYGIEIWMYIKENTYDIDDTIKEITIKQNNVIRHLDNVSSFLQKGEFFEDAPKKIVDERIEQLLNLENQYDAYNRILYVLYEIKNGAKIHCIKNGIDEIFI